jgi:hypothetical protein
MVSRARRSWPSTPRVPTRIRAASCRPGLEGNMSMPATLDGAIASVMVSRSRSTSRRVRRSSGSSASSRPSHREASICQSPSTTSIRWPRSARIAAVVTVLVVLSLLPLVVAQTMRAGPPVMMRPPRRPVRRRRRPPVARRRCGRRGVGAAFRVPRCTGLGDQSVEELHVLDIPTVQGLSSRFSARSSTIARAASAGGPAARPGLRAATPPVGPAE